MEEERVYWKLFGKKLISFKKLENGEIVGTGALNPLLKKLGLFAMIASQANFYKNYDLGRWNGHRVTNTFAPPVGSRPMYRAIKALLKTHLLHRRTPVAMTFAVTYKCQCHCSHCSAGRHARGDVPELTTEEARQLIDDSEKLGVTVIAFTGGEPLLRKDIFELIAHVDQKKAVPILFTNGQLLTGENVQKLADAGLYSLFVSIDSPNPEEHNRERGAPGLFEDAVGGIRRALAKGLFVGISSYASRSGTQKGQYKQLHQMARDLKLHNLILFDCVPTGNLLKDTSEMLTGDQREEIYQYSAAVYWARIVPPLSSQAWQNSIEGNLAGIGCVAASLQYYVTAYGDVAPCDFTPLSFGNIRAESLEKIWNKMVHHPAYSHPSTCCRMQHPRFRHFYIDPIPEGAQLPYAASKLPRVDYRKFFLNQSPALDPECVASDLLLHSLGADAGVKSNRLAKNT